MKPIDQYPTPMTDAESKGVPFVTDTFARRLEQKLAAMTEDRDEAKAAFYKAVENAGPCGACAEGIACGSTMHEHVGCPIAERDLALSQLAECRETLAQIEYIPPVPFTLDQKEMANRTIEQMSKIARAVLTTTAPKEGE